MKKILAMILMVSLLAVSVAAFADAPIQFPGDYGEIICRYASVRPEINSKSTVVRLNNGDQFEILSVQGEWYQVRYTDPTTNAVYDGWLWNCYVAMNPKHIVMDGQAVIRACPMVNNKIVGTVEKNDTYCIMGETDSYYMISFRDATGFILKDSDFHLLEDELNGLWPTPTPAPGGLG